MTMKNVDFTPEQWQMVNDAIEDMIAEDLPTNKLVELVIDTEPTSTFIAERNDFDEDRELVLEFRIRKARLQVEIKEERKMTAVYIGLECVRARLYDYDIGYIDLPQVLCDRITVNLKPIVYGSK